MIRLIYLPSYLLAILWTFFWGTFRFFDYYMPCGFERWAYHSWGRHESPEPIKCECGWMGPVRWLIHDYVEDGFGDVEPQDFCPHCGNEL